MTSTAGAGPARLLLHEARTANDQGRYRTAQATRVGHLGVGF
jgi:hypothetical protein